MYIKLWPDRELRVEKKRVGHVPVLILRPKDTAEGKRACSGFMAAGTSPA